MGISYFEDIIKQAKSIEESHKDSPMSVEEARKLIAHYLAKQPKIPKQFSSPEEKEAFKAERLKVAYAIKRVVADEIDVEPEKIGLAVDKEYSQKPDDMKEETYQWFKTGRGTWWDFEQEKIKSPDFIGVVSLKEFQLLESDTLSFVRILSHELGHTRQTVNGTLNNEGDNKIDEQTEDYLMQNPEDSKARRIVWKAKFIERDADRFADTMCLRFLYDACKECGLSGRLLQMGTKAFKTAAHAVLEHFKGSILINSIMAKAKRFNKNKASEVQEEQPPKVEKVTAQELQEAGFEPQKPYEPNQEQLKREKEQKELSREQAPSQNIRTLS